MLDNRRIDDGRGTADLLNRILEVSGQRKEKDAKVQTAKTMWVPAVNNLGTFGRWAFLEIDGSNPHKTKQEIRGLLRGTDHRGHPHQCVVNKSLYRGAIRWQIN